MLKNFRIISATIHHEIKDDHIKHIDPEIIDSGEVEIVVELTREVLGRMGMVEQTELASTFVMVEHLFDNQIKTFLNKK